MFEEVTEFIRAQFKTDDFIPLHEPRFIGNEKEYLNECIDSTYVSSVGKFVDRFEEMISEKTGAKHTVAVVNGTSALHISMLLAGVKRGDEVITQPLTFVATANAINYTGAEPIFVDVDRETMGMCPEKLREFLKKNIKLSNGKPINILTGKKVKACIPMHTFGFPCEIDKIVSICNKYKIPVIEDSAESIGSFYKNKHTGTYGLLGVFSFNGNKVMTSGGGGCIITDDNELAKKAKHITTTAKIPHKWNYNHDEIGYNYRMPNLNAALACAQLEKLDLFITKKRELANCYINFFKEIEIIDFVIEKYNTKTNYWLMTIILKNKKDRDAFLAQTNGNNVMTRPAWTLLNKLKMFQHCKTGSLENSEWLEERIVNIPSSVIL